jgi:OOP family OmpA-OmpF porin
MFLINSRSKIMKKIVIAALLSAITAAPAFAADEGFYAGVTLGQARTNAFSGAALTKSNDTVYGILGGYQITKNWGAEAFYTGAGKWATTTASGKADTYGINAVGTLPLSDAFSLYGKLGYASTKSTASSAPAGITGATRNAATYGLGGVYNVTPAVGIRFGWDRYAASVVNTGVTSNYNSNVYSLGAVVKF